MGMETVCESEVVWAVASSDSNFLRRVDQSIFDPFELKILRCEFLVVTVSFLQIQ
jgi:CRISPR/Cas system endoribonuclease Cas6 (RAMP superfamily)